MIFKVLRVKEDYKKLEIMAKCDKCFPISLFERDNYDEIIDKILKHAFFIAAFVLSGGGIECVGYNAFYANNHDSKTAFISNIGVLDEFQRFHVGYELMKKSFEISKKEGMEIIRLEVLNSNNKAIAFYRSLGFVFETGGEGDTSFMRRSLNI